MTNRPHALYRFYSADQDLLYVGITLNPSARWADHRDHKLWWTDVATITIEQHPDRDTVLAAERTAIQAERPRYNVVHNRHPLSSVSESDAVMLALVGDRTNLPWGAKAEHMPDVCRDCRDRGVHAIYYPHEWRNDGPTWCTAYYACRYEHLWTCGWGHGNTGYAPAFYGQPAREAS